MVKHRYYVYLHLLLMVYSMSGIFSKKAATCTFLSVPFCLYYGMVILLLAFYAIFWQQIIKYMPLTTAFANKAITVVWGCVWGVLFFDETMNVGKLIGIVLIALGIVVFSHQDEAGGLNE